MACLKGSCDVLLWYKLDNRRFNDFLRRVSACRRNWLVCWDGGGESIGGSRGAEKNREASIHFVDVSVVSNVLFISCYYGPIISIIECPIPVHKRR